MVCLDAETNGRGKGTRLYEKTGSPGSKILPGSFPADQPAGFGRISLIAQRLPSYRRRDQEKRRTGRLGSPESGLHKVSANWDRRQSTPPERGETVRGLRAIRGGTEDDCVVCPGPHTSRCPIHYSRVGEI